MSLDDRIRLVQAIWDDIADEDLFAKLTESQKQELDRRMAAYESSPDDVVPWETVKAQAPERVNK